MPHLPDAHHLLGRCVFWNILLVGCKYLVLHFPHQVGVIGLHKFVYRLRHTAHQIILTQMLYIKCSQSFHKVPTLRLQQIYHLFPVARKQEFLESHRIHIERVHLSYRIRIAIMKRKSEQRPCHRNMILRRILAEILKRRQSPLQLLHLVHYD